MSIWDRFSGSTKPDSSASEASRRLKFVLVHDRNEIPPGMLELIKDDIIAVISRRINIDHHNVEVHVTHEASEGKLIVDIPLLREEFLNSRGSSGARTPKK